MRRYLVLAAFVVLAAVAIAACTSSSDGGPSPTPTPTQTDAGQLSRFVTCVRGYGVSPASPVSVTTVRAALDNAPKAQRKSALRACQQYLAGTDYLGGHKNKSAKSAKPTTSR